jgi:hypothetical protein
MRREKPCINSDNCLTSPTNEVQDCLKTVSGFDGVRRPKHAGSPHLMTRHCKLMGCVAFVVGLCFSAACLAQTTRPVDTIPPEVKFVIQQSKGTYQSVHNVAYRFHVVYQQGSLTQDVTGEAKQSDTLQSESVDQIKTTNQSGETPLHVTGYFGPDNCGFWQHGDSLAVQYLYQSMSTMSDAAKMLIESWKPPHPEKYAFGNGVFFLWDRAAKSTILGSEWKLEKVQRAGASVLKLSWFQKTPDGALTPQPSGTYFLDPNKGYEVIAFEGRFMDGDLLRTHDITLSQIPGSSAWYPTKIVEDYFAPQQVKTSTNSKIEPTWSSETIIDHVNIDGRFQSSDFSLNILGLTKGQQVYQTDATGQESTLKWVGDGLTVSPDRTENNKSTNINSPAEVSVVPLPPTAAEAGPTNLVAISAVGFAVGLGLFFFAIYWLKGSKSGIK